MFMCNITAKDKLIEALMNLLSIKDFNQINVKELCQIANVNRTTFYAYYDNTFELLIDAKDKKTATFNESFKTINFKAENYKELIYLNYFNFVKKEINLYKAYIMNSIPLGSDKDFNVLFKDTLLPRVKKIYNNDETAIYYYTVFFMEELFCIIKRWINNNLKESPEYLAKILDKIEVNFNN